VLKLNIRNRKKIRLSIVACSAFTFALAAGTVFSFGGGGGGWGGGGGGWGGGGGSSEPDLTLDFLPDTNSDGSFGWGGGGGGWGGGGSVGNSDDRTVFLQENVGSYVHQLIGSPDDDFAQDVYILGSAYSSTSMNDPFGRGTGSGNPTRVIMRQRVRDSESVNDFLKDTLQAKPVITSTVFNDEMQINTVIDMSEISYQDDETPAQMTITIEFTNPLLEEEFSPGDFDLATDAQNSTIHAGRFSYSSGSYSYADGDGFNLSGINWAAFCDPQQNLNSSLSQGGGSFGWGSGGADYCEGGNSAGGSSSSGGWGW